ncbi:hypothetical protein [Thermopirellula anaerolimosa]
MLRTSDPAASDRQPPRNARGALGPKPIVECREREMQVRWGSPEPWLRGPWLTTVIRNEATLAPRSDWEQVCRYRDARIEHWEYELKLSHGVRLQRQVTYLTRDGVLFAADAVLSARRAEWLVETACEIGPAVVRTDGMPSVAPAAEGAAAAWFLPLIPPENASAGDGTPSIHSGMTVGRGRSRGRACFLPFVLILPRDDVERRSPPFRRSLTVTERGRVVAADAAVAYRVQLGSRQWVFYRSLAAPANRAFLGCNFAGESLVGTFGKKGVTALLEVQMEG